MGRLEEANKAVIRKYWEEVLNTGDTSRIEDFIDPAYTEVFEGKRYPIGIEGAISHVTGVRKTYHGLKLAIDHQVAEGEWVATLYTMTGIHMEEWLGIKPTGKPVRITGVNYDRVVKGKIVEHGGAANMLFPLLEIGAVKVVGRDG
jgi:predicted ester cyclase